MATAATNPSTTTAENKTQGKTKHRSPNYPAIGLKAAIDLVRDLYNNAKRSTVDEAVAVKAMGYKGLNGTTRGHVSALPHVAGTHGTARFGRLPLK